MRVSSALKTGVTPLRVFSILILAIFVAVAFSGNVNVSANHPVLVEGNCDSPVPGTTIVNIGQCGDYDGDGRIGTAEDTDGADRIFGTLKAALGPGTGAAAGTGANNNGTIIIVRSGRFAEQLLIGSPHPLQPDQGTAVPGNVTIEAAPGVTATIDAVLQGDPAGGNTARQAGAGIVIYYENPGLNDRVVILRNLSIRNWSQGVYAGGVSSVIVDNCLFEHNNSAGMIHRSTGNLVVTNSQFNSNGRRIPVSGPPNPGDGLAVGPDSGVGSTRIFNSTFSNNVGAGIRNETGSAAKLKLFKVATYLNGTDIVGPFTISTDPNYSN
jgi:hypothetical protein